MSDSKNEITMSEASNNQKKPRGRPFEPGNKLGTGRPEGSRNKATLALQALLDSEGETITRKAIEMAKSGDTTAMRLVIERLIPPTKERRINLDLPKVETPQEITS